MQTTDVIDRDDCDSLQKYSQVTSQLIEFRRNLPLLRSSKEGHVCEERVELLSSGDI